MIISMCSRPGEPDNDSFPGKTMVFTDHILKELLHCRLRIVDNAGPMPYMLKLNLGSNDSVDVKRFPV